MRPPDFIWRKEFLTRRKRKNTLMKMEHCKWNDGWECYYKDIKISERLCVNCDMFSWNKIGKRRC